MKILELESNYAALLQQIEDEQVWIWNKLSGQVDRDIGRLNRLYDMIKAAKAAHEAIGRREPGTLTGGVQAPGAAAGGGGGSFDLQAMRDWQKKAAEEEEARRVATLAKWKEGEAEKAAAAKRRIDEEARLRWASIDEEARLRYEIDRAEIEATKEGLDKRLALLKLEYRARLEQAAMAGADLGLVKRLYEAQRRLLVQGAETAKVARRFEVRGQFGGLGAERLGGANTADRIAEASEQTARNTKRLVSATRQGGLVFG